MKRNKLRNRIRFILLAILVLALLISVIAPMAASAAETSLSCTYLEGTNINEQNYPTRGSTVKSYLTVNGDQYMRVQASVTGEDGVVVCYYTSDFSLVSRKVIAQELPVFGGFYESSSNYFLFTGQRNPDEDDSVEVFRITKYDKNWKRLGSCSLYGANTYIPFAAGSCRMTMDGKYLLVRTAHEMYTSEDGLHHQANVTIEVDTSTMTVTDSYTAVMNNRVGYVSHSFNQFIRLENHQIISIDHGDAHPRSICLMIYPTDVSTGQFQAEYFNNPVNTISVLDFPGSLGQNDTGASVGGLEISSSHYLTAGNSVPQDDADSWNPNGTRNIFVAAVDKTSLNVDFRWITSYAEGAPYASTPHLVPVGNDRYLLLWTRIDGYTLDGKVYYTFLDADGTAGKIYTMTGSLSDCVPIVCDGKVTWYTWDDGMETFYQIPLSAPDKPTSKVLTFGHDYQLSSCKNGHVVLKCTKCGGTTEGEAPVSFTAWWRTNDSSDSYYYYSIPSDLEAGDILEFMLSNYTYGVENPSVTFVEMVGTSGDPTNCVLDMDARTVTLKKAGTYTVTIYPKYNPDAKNQYTIKVPKPLASVKLSAAKASPQTFGASIQLTAAADGGKGTLNYKFIATESDGTETEIQNSTGSTCTWKPENAGTYSLQVTATDPVDNKTVKSSKISFTINKKSITGAEVSGIKTKTYTGKALKQSLTVTVDGVKLENKADYKVSYKNNTAAGKATVTIQGIDNYTGTITKSFYIKPAKTKISSVKNSAKKTMTVKWAKAKSGTGYQVQYGLKKNFSGAKTVKIKKLGTTSKKIKKLKKGKTYYVRVRVYKTVGSKTLYSKWSAKKSIKIKK